MAFTTSEILKNLHVPVKCFVTAFNSDICVKTKVLVNSPALTLIRNPSQYTQDFPVNGIERRARNALFRQLQLQKNYNDELLQWRRPLQYNVQRHYFWRKKDKNPKKNRIPKLILLQNPFTWLMVKIDFGILRVLWDPTFAERDFKFGTKQAISRVTQVISEGKYSDLNGLLTKAARLSLMRELDRNWGERQRSLVGLKRDDIQISSPRKVYFIRMADKKFCDVDMAFLALKWAPINNIDSLIFAEIFARFHREYTPHCIPEWTIAYFKVTRFEVLRRLRQ